MDANRFDAVVRVEIEKEFRKYVKDWAATTGTKFTGMNANILVDGLVLAARRVLTDKGEE